MAATRLIALHKNKGKTVAACLKNRTDYVQNPDKTEQGELVSCHECSPLTVDEEFIRGNFFLLQKVNTGWFTQQIDIILRI